MNIADIKNGDISWSSLVVYHLTGFRMIYLSFYAIAYQTTTTTTKKYSDTINQKRMRWSKKKKKKTSIDQHGGGVKGAKIEWNAVNSVLLVIFVPYDDA